MKKQIYITPETEVVRLHVSDPVLEIGDLFVDSAEEDHHEWWVGGKENGGIFDETPFGSLWDDDPVEDPFQLDY